MYKKRLTAACLLPSLRSPCSHSNDLFTRSSTYSAVNVPEARARRPTALAVSSVTPVSGLLRSIEKEMKFLFYLVYLYTLKFLTSKGSKQGVFVIRRKDKLSCLLSI